MSDEALASPKGPLDDILWVPVSTEGYIFINPASKATLSPSGEFRFARMGEWATYPDGSPFMATFSHGAPGVRTTQPAIILKLAGYPTPRTFAERLRAALPARSELLLAEAEVLERGYLRAEAAEALADGAIAAMSEYKNAVELCAVKMDERGRWVETKRYLDAKVAVEVALAKHAESKKVQP